MHAQTFFTDMSCLKTTAPEHVHAGHSSCPATASIRKQSSRRPYEQNRPYPKGQCYHLTFYFMQMKPIINCNDCLLDGTSSPQYALTQKQLKGGRNPSAHIPVVKYQSRTGQARLRL